MLLVHRSPQTWSRAFRALYHAGNHYALHVDRLGDAGSRALAAELAREHGNVHLVRPRNVRWGCWSLVAAELAGIRLLLREPGWTHLIVLSGQCFPLRSPEEIRAFFAAQRERSFLEWFDGLRGWEGNRVPRIDQTIVELPLSKRRLLLERPLRRRFLLGSALWASGPSWVALGREAAAYATSAAALRLRVALHNTVSPAESYFQTALLDSPLRESLVNRCLHYADWSAGGWHPNVLGLEDLERVELSGALFARKVDVDADAGLVEALERRLGRAPGER